MKRKSMYDGAPPAARKLIAEAITADTMPSVVALVEKLKAAGMRKAGTPENLRRYIALRRKRAGKSVPTKTAAAPVTQAELPPVVRVETTLGRAPIEVLPDGRILTSDPELAVRIAQILAGSAS